MPFCISPRGEEAVGNQVSNKRAMAKWLTFRPLVETTRDTLAWFKAQSQDRQSHLKVGLTPEHEAEVLAAWHKQIGMTKSG